MEDKIEIKEISVKQIAEEIYFIMHSFHCTSCDLWYSKEDYRDKPICPQCGNDLR